MSNCEHIWRAVGHGRLCPIIGQAKDFVLVRCDSCGVEAIVDSKWVKVA